LQLLQLLHLQELLLQLRALLLQLLDIAQEIALITPTAIALPIEAISKLIPLISPPVRMTERTRRHSHSWGHTWPHRARTRTITANNVVPLAEKSVDLFSIHMDNLSCSTNERASARALR
jgi:hypothetical protein